jgi:hypothetical protein
MTWRSSRIRGSGRPMMAVNGLWIWEQDIGSDEMKRVDVESRVCVDELGSGNGKNFRLTNRPKERAKILMILSK